MDRDASPDTPPASAPGPARPAHGDPGRAPAVPPVTWVDHTGSTQRAVLEAAEAAPGDWPHLRALATLDQRTGRGRQGRDWTTPAGTALSFSVVLRPAVDVRHWSWTTLLAAAVAARELRRRGIGATVKWPNDVLAPDGRKLCGILAGVLPGQSGLVLGLGLNLDFGPHGAPVPTATSMVEWLPGTGHPAAGELARDVLPALLRSLGAALEDFTREVRAHPGAEVDGSHPAVRDVVAHLGTLGTGVRAELPGGAAVTGTARGLGPGGTLLIEPAGRGKMDPAVPGATRRGGLLEVSAADVVHLRR
ncbi:biotin--[acetyl-CoA-carboxylase] ligase [Citricoccus sp. SGAir0253]|uniref:biotin--[acetyl-CoA-carboxylase] ligase n=1 Tax=Citricoccus sp. SGAir0253 TaxID=2567881 RepID=UPI0010CCFCDC|nr:biotin--[acetyl-CoA-carboxylase] ligase [Citricoccus sp. SGAir0253]QCU78596.1 biotin--[acetyl-CoA-carboxylase] ligase [Citricoccus sp. SGAir0253]